MRHYAVDKFDTTDAEGRKFLVEITYDICTGPPEEEHDGHGVVCELDFAPDDEGALEDYLDYYYEEGSSRRMEEEARFAMMERITNNGHRYTSEKFYDVWATLEVARKEGWGSVPPDAPDAAEQLLEVVRADMEYLRGWYQNDWCWVVVTVTPYDSELDQYGDPVLLEDYEQAIGGVEYAGDVDAPHVVETITELCAEAAHAMSRKLTTCT